MKLASFCAESAGIPMSKSNPMAILCYFINHKCVLETVRDRHPQTYQARPDLVIDIALGAWETACIPQTHAARLCSGLNSP